MAGEKGFPLNCDTDGKAGRVGEPFHETLGETGRHVLDDEHGQGKILWQSGEDGLQSERAAGGSADSHNLGRERPREDGLVFPGWDRRGTSRTARPSFYHSDFG